VPKGSGGALISIVPKSSSSSREALLGLMRAATEQLFILYIQLLDRCERHPSRENPNHSQHALNEVVYRIEKWKNPYNMAGILNFELESFSPRTLEIPSEECSSNTDHNCVSCMRASPQDIKC
jgi:hypothetical protein